MNIAETSVADFLDRLASSDAAPGGGAVAALSGAQVAALASMVIAVGAKGAPTAVQQSQLHALHEARIRLLQLATDDGVVFSEVMAAYKLPKSTDSEKATRSATLERALHGATHVPLTVMREVAALWPVLADVAAQANVNLASDSAIAVDLWGGTLRAARYNVLINLKYVKNEGFRASASAECAALVSEQATKSEVVLRKLETLF